jgi:hypothetical protein
MSVLIDTSVWVDHFRNRNDGLLRSPHEASLAEVMAFIERESVFGRGCGLVDMVLLTSTLMTPGAKLWSLDKRLAEMAEGFDIGYRNELH